MQGHTENHPVGSTAATLGSRYRMPDFLKIQVTSKSGCAGKQKTKQTAETYAGITSLGSLQETLQMHAARSHTNVASKHLFHGVVET